jgi:hypothetical protein
MSLTVTAPSRGWAARARDNIAAIRLSKEIEAAVRAPTPEEQAQLLRFVRFGATELAQLPGATGYRQGWEAMGRDLADAVTPAEYAAQQRATQHAHYTPESVVRALWHVARRLGFASGRVLEPGMGTDLFFALLPDALCGATQLTGIEYDPVTARIARLIHPEARIRCQNYTRSNLAGDFDLVIGNPPFADRIVRADPSTPTWSAPCVCRRGSCTPRPARRSSSTCWCFSVVRTARRRRGLPGRTSSRG